MKVKAKVKCIAMFIFAVLVAVFTVGYAFAWLFDKKDAKFELTGASAGAYFESGDGSEETPFIISNATHMRNLAVLQNTGRFGDNQYHFEIKKTLTQPLNMGGIWLPPIGNDVYPFIGDFNGNGKTIVNLKVTTDKALLTETNYPTQAAPDYEFSQAVGLFGNTGKKSNISNFILDNPHVVVGAVGVHNNLYKETGAKVVGIAVGHVAGKCSSIGVRATDAGANTADGVGSTTLDVRVIGYSTFNSILGELGAGVTSSITGGGAGSEGTGGSGNAFGASFDVQTYALRLFAMEENHTLDTPSYYLPIGARGSNDYPVLRAGERMPFTVSNAINKDNYKTIYKDMGSKAMETIAENNIGYVLGNQTKLNEKTLTFAEAMTQSGDANGTWTYSHEPDRNHVPMWFYTRDKSKYDSESYGYDKNTTGVEAITIEQYNSLPAGIKNLLPIGADRYIYEDTANNIHQPNDVTNPNIGTQASYFTIRLSANLTYESIRNNGNTNNNDWSYHGQISWMGKTYGKGFSDKDGYAVDENGNYYSSSGNLLGADGYDRDADGHYGVDLSKFANFPYIAYSYDLVSGTAYALDENGNRYYAYKRDNGEYVYGILNGGYLMTGDGYNSYAAPMAGWTQPILLIDADGYAMYAPGVYYDVSGNTLVGGYVKDGNYYVPVDSNFLLPIPNGTNGYAQDADGNYYGVITLNGQTVYCYLGANGKAAGYSGYYQIDGNNFLVAATNVDADGFVKYNATDYYGTYDGTSGYVDANGYFYDANGNYYATDANFTEVIKNISSSGYAMTADGKYYYGKGTVNNNTVYGLIDVRNGKSYLKVDGKYLATDGNSYDTIDDEGRVMYDSNQYYGLQYGSPVILTKDKCLYDSSLDAKGNPKGYSFYDNHWCLNNRGYEACNDVDNENYGYYVKKDDPNTAFINYFATGADKRLKAWGYTADEINAIVDTGKIGLDENDWFNPNDVYLVKTGESFIYAVEGGEYISVAEGTKNRAISSADINGIEGEFIALQEGEKFAVVKDSAELDSVTVGEGKKVKFNAFIGGIALPNNAIWFKPSQAGTLKFVMFADSEANGFALMRIHRGTDKRDPASDDFFGVVNYDTDMGFSWERIIMQKLPKGILFYYEYEISQDEIDMGNIEYILCMQGNGGAHFLYLDIGSSASEEVEDTSTVVPDTVSAIDFIYDGVEIEQTDTTIGVGNFIVTTSGNKALYVSSKTSVYFEDITAVLKVVYVRLHNDDKQGHSGKTICLEYSDPKLNTDSEVKATFATYVCPTISGGSGTASSGGGGGGPVTPNPGPDDPVAVTSVSISGAPATLTVGGTATLTANVTPSNATDKTVTWTSSDNTVISVDSNGNIKALKAGTATITATANDGSNKSATTDTITVNAASGGEETGGIASGTVVTFDGGSTYPDGVTVSGSNKSGSASVTIDGVTIGAGKALKIDSNSPLKIKLDKDMKVELYLMLNDINVNGTNLTNGVESSDGTTTYYKFTVTLNKNTEYVFKRGSKENQLYLIKFVD